ncbi:50S ribosome-binding GTPase [Candidatus Pacearchaeota archaeon]|nr:50S ribosome-binding GTPase [Candidatus Pacearchaeota archaeon]
MVRVRYSFGSRHTGNIKNIKKQKKTYPDIMEEVVQISDIVLEVLDARFIEETRNLAIEKDIKKLGKKIIYILNKADLIDVKAVEKGLSEDLRPRIFVSVLTKMGSKDLRDRIRIEAKRVKLKDVRERVQVGIVGYPNVGKSSLINLISRRGAAKISKQAGYTKGMQKIKMCEGILILDTPGVISRDKYSSSEGKASSSDARVGARTYSDVKNPENVVQDLMSSDVKMIEKFYKIETEGDSDELIEQLGKVKGFLKKGGEIDVDRTARLILRDWQEGKINRGK